MISHDDLHDLMRTRRSVRRFRPDLPARAVIESLLASAVTAPSASNKQPWRFLVVENRDVIGRMAAAVREAVDRIAVAVEPQFEAAFRSYGDYFTRFEVAPLVIVALSQPLTLLTTLTGPRLADDDRRRVSAMERDSGLIGTSMAMQNLLLAAHAAGLGASGMTGPLVAADRIRELLHVPPAWHIAALVPVGYPDEEPVPTARKSVDHVTRWVR
jgi:nitroreductase